MLVSLKDITLMVQGDDRVWVDCDSMIVYLRGVETEGRDHGEAAKAAGDPWKYTAASAVSDALRQIADSLTLAGMEARETMRGRRVH